MNRKLRQEKRYNLYIALPRWGKVLNRVKDVTLSAFQHWEAQKWDVKPNKLWEEFEDVPQAPFWEMSWESTSTLCSSGTESRWDFSFVWDSPAEVGHLRQNRERSLPTGFWTSGLTCYHSLSGSALPGLVHIYFICFYFIRIPDMGFTKMPK